LRLGENISVIVAGLIFRELVAGQVELLLIQEAKASCRSLYVIIVS
jgi:hypothetical protein